MGTSVSPWSSGAMAVSADEATIGAIMDTLTTSAFQWQGLTLVHFSGQPEPFLTQSTPYTPPNTP
jgi:peptidase E